MARTPEKRIETEMARVALLIPKLEKLGIPHDNIEASSQLTLYYRAFDAYMGIGQTIWRAKLGDCRSAFFRAVEIGRRALAAMTASSLDAFSQPFFFETAVFLNFLLINEFDAELFAGLDPSQLALKKEKRFIRRLPDTFLLETMRDGNVSRKWKPFVDRELSTKPHSTLFRNTYKSYMEVISHAIAAEPSDTLSAIERSDLLYDERKNDEFNCFNNHDGASFYNDLMVDYRLAAIIKFASAQLGPAFSNKVKSIHKWPY